MLRKIYNKTLQYAQHPHASRYLALVSFAESIFFPIPPDVLLMPMVIAARQKAFFYAFICTVASIFGAMGGYFLGMFFFQKIALPIISFYDYMDSFFYFKDIYNRYGLWFISVAALTPVPFKVITIASGFFDVPFLLFVGVSTISRAMRFYMVSTLLYFFGKPIQGFVEKNFSLVTSVFFVFLVGGYFAFKYF